MRTQKGANVPKGRRGHSALVHRGAMLLYGGYRDLRGSSNELWAFHFGKFLTFIAIKNYVYTVLPVLLFFL